MSETVVKAPEHVTDFISDITYERGVPEDIRFKYSEKTKIVRAVPATLKRFAAVEAIIEIFEFPTERKSAAEAE